MGKGHQRGFTEEDAQMANTLMKTYSVSLVIRKIKPQLNLLHTITIQDG